MRKNLSRKLFIFLILAFSVLIKSENVFATTTVSTFQELENAINGNETDIVVNGTIEVEHFLEINRDIKISSLNGGGLKAKKLHYNGIPADNLKFNQIFYVDGGKTLNLEDITLDGNQKGRIVYANSGSTVNIKNSIIKKGSTDSFSPNTILGEDKQIYSGGAIYSDNAKLNIENTEFSDNCTNYETPIQTGTSTAQESPHGGAIMARNNSIVNIKGGKFLNNYAGMLENKTGGNGEGGAIKLEDSTLNINDENTTDKNTTIFSGNHLGDWKDRGGLQGGAIEATNSKVKIYGTSFTVPGPFNTGGAIKFEDCMAEENIIKNCDFKLDDNKGIIGTAGGAITSEGSRLTIDSSTFATGKGSQVLESGGLIQVANKGEFNLRNSTLTGSGVDWNKTGTYKTAKYGGAIVFYDNCTVKASIENTTIQNFTAEISGGAIALNTQIGKGENSAVDLKIKDTKILNNVTYDFGMTTYGGGIFVGKGNTVEIQGGEISSTVYSGVAGAIYNEGNLTITGTKENPAKIINNKAYHMAGGVLNDGYLKVDYATFSGNKKGDWSNSNQHVYNKGEMAGENIYAVKDIIITPNAYFDNKDVRILDGQSSIVLTGALPQDRHINVSISESPKKQPAATENNPLYPLHPKFNEIQNRKVGYLVAKGDGNYVPTESDAKALNYVSKDFNQKVAAADDHTGLGEWDFVLNPENNTVVLGQRAKVIFDPNGTADWPAHHENMANELTKEKDFVVYSTTSKIPELEKPPIRESYTFTGWYLEEIVNDNSEDENQNGKTPVKTLEDIRGNKDEITEILDPHEYTLYAGWKKGNITVEKIWDDEENKYKNRPESVVVELLVNGETKGTVTLSEENKWKDEFKNVPQSTEDSDYSVKEKEVPKGYTVSYGGNSKDGFKVTNTYTQKFKVKYEFISGTEGKTLPQEIIDLLPKDKGLYEKGTKIDAKDFEPKSLETADGIWKFESWDENQKTIENKDIKFIGTWKFTDKKADFIITKTVDKKCYKKSGEILKYTVIVKNVGEKDLKDLKITDSLVEIAKNTFDLNKGETKEFKYEYLITDSDVKREFIKNIATVKSDGSQKSESTISNLEKCVTPVEEIKTEYIDEDGKDIIPPENGDHPPKEIPGYEYIKTDRTKYLVSHIYRKIARNIDVDPWLVIGRYEPVTDGGLLNKDDHKAYMFGYPDWTFRPDNNMTRAEVTAMFARLLKNYPIEKLNYDLNYPDVNSDDWYYEAVGFMNENQIIKGYDDGYFRPNKPITRAEFATIASRFDSLTKKGGTKFNDISSDYWALEYINSAAARGWIKGYGDGSFKPERNITRAEVVTITDRMLERYADEEFILRNKTLLFKFKDLEESHWAYFNIMEATHGHDFSRIENKLYEKWYRLNDDAFKFPEVRYK